INTLTPGPKTTPPTEYPDIAVHLYWSDDSALVMRLRIAPSLGEFLHQQRHMQARNARAATLPKDQAYAISLLAAIWGKDNEEVLREFLAADLATAVDNELADEEGSIPRRDDLHGAGFYQDEIAACLESLRASQ
nr:hypothetical protein [Candidatus Saccharibacteria bacterium]